MKISNFDPDNFPLHRLLHAVMEKDLKPRYLIITEAVLVSLLLTCIYFYFR